MLNYFYNIYYSIKTYYYIWFPKKNAIQIKNISNESIEQINIYNNNINKLNLKLDTNLYKTLSRINKNFNEKSDIDSILLFLDNEENFIIKSKDNLSINNIIQNTYIIDLKKNFLILKEIKDIEKKLKKI